MPVASATAAPPEEPAAERDVFHGLRVAPNTSLKVLRAGAEFRRVRHRVDDAALRFEMLDQNVGLLRHVVRVDRRALRGAHARDIDQVLDRDRHAGKLAALRDRLLHQPVGMLARPVEAARRQRIDGAIDRRDALFQRVEQIVRRDLAALEARRRWSRHPGG